MMPSFDDNDAASPAVASSEAQPSPPKPTVVEEEPAKSNSTEAIEQEHEPEPEHKQQLPPPSASTSTTSSDTGEDGGLWGLTSAFGGASGWGLGGVAAETTSASSSSAAAIKGEHRQTGATDVELAELENSIAAAETAVSTAIWSTFAAVSSAVGGATTSGEANPKKDSNAPLTDEDLDAILTGESPKGNDEASKPETPEAAAAASNPNTTTTTATTEESQAPAPSPIPETAPTSTSIWSSLGAVVSETLIAPTASTEEGENEDGVSNQVTTATATASSTLYNLYTSNVNRAAEWIEDLERAQSDNDPYKRLKNHLNTYLAAHPRGNYEEWVENYLGEHGWDASDHHSQSNAAPVVVDSSYYTEDCPHRILWNEKCYQDGIQIDDENPSRAYVPTPSTKEDRRHRTSVNDDEEIITFDANDNDDDKSNSTPNNADDGDDGPQAAAAAPPASPPTEQQQQPLFKDDASLVVVQKPSPVLSCSTLDTRSDDGSGILVPKTTSTLLGMPQEEE